MTTMLVMCPADKLIDMYPECSERPAHVGHYLGIPMKKMKPDNRLASSGMLVCRTAIASPEPDLQCRVSSSVTQS